MADTELDIDDLCDTITESMSADDRQTRSQYQAACAALSALRNECEKLRARVAELEQAHAEQVAERELRYSAWEKIESWRESDPGSHDAEIVVATDSGGMRFTGKDAPVSALAWCESERARQAKDGNREEQVKTIDRDPR